ncbi:EamA family transporter [Aquicoccus sp. SCR17]|nr:EamA family transporter [Carideicomes alvinocaridis]
MSPRARAVLFMITAFLFFSGMDACAKALGQRVGPVPAVWARYLGQSLVVLILVAPRLRSVARTRYPGLQFARSALLLTGTTCFFFALTQIGLAEATAVMDLNPVLVTLGAALFLGERLGARRVMGIGAALVGALIIIRPGSAVFSPYAVLPLCGAVAYASYQLITRHVGRDEDPWTSMLYAALLGAVVLSCVVPFHWQRPDAVSILLMLAIAACGTLSQLFLIRALTAGEASMLAPFAYVGLIFAAFWGAVFFGELPDGWTVLGAAIIAVAGIYVWYRETFTDARAAPGTEAPERPAE